MDDEERLLSCQREIFRLRNVVMQMQEVDREFEAELKKEIEKSGSKNPGLIQALDLWQKIQKEE